jgi:hypothetical protein
MLSNGETRAADRCVVRLLSIVVGPTLTGCATIAGLRLNFVLTVVTRALWTGTGVHPLLIFPKLSIDSGASDITPTQLLL